MKDLINKLLPLLTSLKGKKPIVIIIAILAVAAGLFAVHKGYIPESALNIDAIVNEVSSAFTIDSVHAVVDSLPK